jgi:hypothetical protein
METNNSKNKEFDAVKMMREIREKINSETKGMTFEQLRIYIDSKLANKKRLIGQK